MVECGIMQKAQHLSAVFSTLVGKSDRQIAEEILINPSNSVSLERSMHDVGKFVNILLKTSKSVNRSIKDPLEAAGLGDAEGEALLELGVDSSDSEMEETKSKKRKNRGRTVRNKRRTYKMAQAIEDLTLQENPATPNSGL
eukprot:jgi/Botrbrau1/20664/Bobra.0468s0001.1